MPSTQSTHLPLPRALLLLGLVAGLCSARPALAWQQYHVGTAGGGCGLRWYQNSIDFHVGELAPQSVTHGELAQAALDGLNAWHNVECAICTSSHGVGCLPEACAPSPLGLDFHYVADPAGTLPPPVGGHCKKADGNGTCVDMESNGNYVQVISDAATWQATSHAGSGVFALTVLTYNTQSGAIVDADILLDDADADFCTHDCPDQSNNLRNTLTHESGHFIGLDHSPDTEATMYAFAPHGDLKKISLAQDDRNAACTAYRTACSSQSCPKVAYVAPDAGSLDAGDTGSYGTACNEARGPGLASGCPVLVPSASSPRPSGSCQASGRSPGAAWLLGAVLIGVALRRRRQSLGH